MVDLKRASLLAFASSCSVSKRCFHHHRNGGVDERLFLFGRRGIHCQQQRRRRRQQLLATTTSPSDSAEMKASSPSVTDVGSLVPSWLSRKLEGFDLRVHMFYDDDDDDDRDGSGGGLRGLQTTIDRDAGDVIMTVPHETAVTAVGILRRYDDLRAAAQRRADEKRKKKLAEATTTKTKTFIVRLLTDEQIMALGLLRLRDENDRYVQSLPPKQYSILFMPTEFLDCFPPCYRKVVHATWKYTNQLHSSARDALRWQQGSSSSSSSSSSDAEDKIESSPPSIEDFRWAFSTVRSRSIGLGQVGQLLAAEQQGPERDWINTVGGNEVRALLPGLDLLNHRAGTKSGLQFSKSRQEWALKTGRPYRKGDQIHISYGDSRDNMRMLLTYGFAIRDNPTSSAFFDLDDLLAGCTQARPALFPKPIIDMLREQVFSSMDNDNDDDDDEEQNGGEDGGVLFGYDGKMKRPQQSLSRAIAMMKGIAEQLVQSSLSSESKREEAEKLLQTLEADVLRAMIQTRRAELSMCLTTTNEWLMTNRRFSNGDDEDSDGWKQFLSSIRVLLEEELAFLPSR